MRALFSLRMVVILTPINYLVDICVILISNWKKTFVSNVLVNNEEDDLKLLMYSAIEKNDIETVRDLLEIGTSIAEANKNGLTALEHAMKHRRIKITKLLLSSYEIPRINCVTDRDLLPLFVASKIGNLNFLERWMDRGLSLNISNSFGDTPFHYATRYFHSERGYFTIKFLLKNGADPNSKNEDGLTPLHLIVSTFKKKMHVNCYLRSIIRWLVKGGADVNSQNLFGKTPLHLARLHRDFNCIFDLLRFGADINIEDNRGFTMMDCIYEKLESRNCFDDLTDSRTPKLCEKHLYEPIRILIFHVIQMKTVNLCVNEKISLRIDRLANWFNFIKKAIPKFSKKYYSYGLSTDDIDVFTKKCKEEKEKLQKTKLDNHISMYNIICMNDSEISKIVNKKVFKQYFHAGQFKEEFPLYWYFLESRYSVGVIRNVILPYARDSLKFCRLPLPEVCLDKILDQFGNNELFNLINIILPKIKQQYEITQMSSALVENKFNLGMMFV